MTDWIERPLSAIAAGPVTASAHARVLQTTEALHRIEMGPPSAPIAAHADWLQRTPWQVLPVRLRWASMYWNWTFE